MRRAAAVLGLIALIPVTAAAQLSADSAARIDQVFARFNHTDTPGCVVGLDRGGIPLYRRAYGMADLQSGSPLTVESVGESGSVAKQFTAGAVVLLALEGRLDLDDPVRKHIPELPDYGAPVTIRMLLHHTSGVRDMWTLFALAGRPSGSVLYTMPEALAMVYRQRELNFPPNSEYLYSNSGFLLLAEIVHRVSGKPLAAFSRDRFFQPLGMHSTQWRDDWNRIVPRRATAYEADSAAGYRTAMPYMDVYGAGGLLTTVDDLLRWNRHLDNPTIGGRRWADTLAARGRLNDGKEIGYGFGLAVSSYQGTAEFSHSGATGGYRTFLARWPERRLSLAMLCNVATAATEALGHEVADVFMGSGPARAPASNRPARVAEVRQPLTAAVLATYAGTYYSPELDVTYRVAASDSGLTVAVGPNEPRPLRAAGTDRFTGGSGLEFQWTRQGSNRLTGFLLSAGRVRNLRFERRSQ
ncbi:MAG: serine hydrolase domain-containing protein [Gemmatimonadales bacterium]